MKIFVSIANYRDREAPFTVLSLLDNAAKPDMITVGVLSQIDLNHDADCMVPDLPNIRQMVVHPSESKGACWARHRILTELRESEAYVLQVDSHSRFAPGWDAEFIEMLSRCSSANPVLTTYPVGYRPPNELGQPCIPVLTPYKFNEHGVLLFKTKAFAIDKKPQTPVPHAFLGGNCLFARSSAFDEVPYDPHLYFHGEEISMAVRLWTHGWDLFAPNDILMYHDYTHNRGRPKHWDDHGNWSKINKLSFARLRYLLANECPDDSSCLINIEKYGLGQARSLDQYQEFAGVNFKLKTIRS